MDEYLAHLLGFLFSDGSVYYDKSKRTFCIQFTNKSQNLLSVFKALMKQCFGVDKFYEIKTRSVTSVRVFSKTIAENLFQLSPTFRTLPCKQFPQCNRHEQHGKPYIYNSVEYPPCQIPEEILTNNIFAKSFLLGFTSGDGSLYINYAKSIYVVELTCFHPFLRNQLIECLKFLGFSTRSNSRAVYISGKENVANFLLNVGFVK